MWVIFIFFNSICYILNDREYLGKFDAKNVTGTLGYSTNSKAYCVCNMRMQIIMESTNVFIDDSCDFFWVFKGRKYL